MYNWKQDRNMDYKLTTQHFDKWLSYNKTRKLLKIEENQHYENRSNFFNMDYCEDCLKDVSKRLISDSFNNINKNMKISAP